MARYTGPVCRMCRRENMKLFLKGDRCYTDKCAVERRNYAPGQHGQGRVKVTDYGTQLREKQRMKRTYGLLENQFRSYFEKAERMKGVTGENLLVLLERRLDSMVYRMGFATSRIEARQLVRHSHFAVNGRRTNIPSFLVRPGDVITIREGSRVRTYFKELRSYMAERAAAPEWLDVNGVAMQGTVLRLPERRDIDLPLNEQLIVEYYSR